MYYSQSHNFFAMINGYMEFAFFVPRKKKSCFSSEFLCLYQPEAWKQRHLKILIWDLSQDFNFFSIVWQAYSRISMNDYKCVLLVSEQKRKLISYSSRFQSQGFYLSSFKAKKISYSTCSALNIFRETQGFISSFPCTSPLLTLTGFCAIFHTDFLV